MKDKVVVSGLAIHAKHGCHAEERRTGGPFEVDITVDGDFSAAGASDNIGDAVDYVTLMNLAKEEMAIPRDLIETVAETLAAKILETIPLVDGVEVTIKKLQPPVEHHVGYVACTIYRNRAGN